VSIKAAGPGPATAKRECLAKARKVTAASSTQKASIANANSQHFEYEKPALQIQKASDLNAPRWLFIMIALAMGQNQLPPPAKQEVMVTVLKPSP